MDIEPIYCAEQIVVPPDLADVLKAYTKEIIRRQPENLIEFSALYFANLASVANSAQKLVPPNLDQLHNVYNRIYDNYVVPAVQLLDLCQEAGIRKGSLNKALEIGNFGPDSPVDGQEFLLLLITMSSVNVASTIEALFKVFGEEGIILTAKNFLKLLQHLGNYDSEVSKQLQEDIASSLRDVETVTYDHLTVNPVLKEMLAVL